MTELKVDWCDHTAATYAVMHWHYSRTMPMGKLVKVGAWEDGKFVGAIVFAWGTAPHIGDPYSLKMTEMAELVRVALRTHVSPVSRIVAEAIRLLRTQSPGLRLLVSYADPGEGHHGGIYQAMNWLYVGKPAGTRKWRANGQHNRRFGTRKDVAIAMLGPNVVFEYDEPKHKYLFPLDRKMRKQIEPLRKPYPKRDVCGPSVESDTSGDQPEGAGATPAGRSISPELLP